MLCLTFFIVLTTLPCAYAKKNGKFGYINKTGGVVIPFIYDDAQVDNNNYFKLRDIAKVLSDTNSRFDVVWDTEKNAITLDLGMSYTVVGGELAEGDGVPRTGLLSKSKIYINGIDVSIAGYVINGNDYFNLRDLGHFLKFDVSWDGVNKIVEINTKFLP